MSSNKNAVRKKRKQLFSNQKLYRRINFSFSILAISVTAGTLLLALFICIIFILSLNKRHFVDFNKELAGRFMSDSANMSELPEAEKLDYIFGESLIEILNKQRNVSVKITLGPNSQTNDYQFDEVTLQAKQNEEIYTLRYEQDLKPIRFKHNSEYYYYISYSLDSGGNQAVFEVFENISDQYVYVIALSGVVLFSLLMMLLFFLLFGRSVAKKSLEPLQYIAESVKEVSEKNLQIKFEQRAHGSEVDMLIIELNNMLHRLELSFEEQSRFVSDVSHELRIPLTIIQGYIDIIKTWGKNDKAMIEESIDSISDEINKTKVLVENLLYLQNIGSGNVQLNMRLININNLALKGANEAKMLSKEHEINTRIKSQKVHIYADETLLEQALRAVVDNSIKYTKSGGTITIGTSLERMKAVIYVKDSGVGISADHIDMVKERFYRVDSARSRSTGGSGLGLSIVNALITAMGGEFRLTSSKGKGTTAEFRFARKVKIK